MKWYIMNVFNGKEKTIKEKIEKELELTKMNIYVNEILLPKENYYQIRKGKKITAERNYMPGYIMIECDMNGELLGVIKNINGVISILGDNGKPTPMRQREVDRLLKKSDEIKNKNTNSIEHDFIIGQKIEIISGPFTSMFGTITELLPEKNKIKVDVNIFNRKTSIELTFEQIINK